MFHCVTTQEAAHDAIAVEKFLLSRTSSLFDNSPRHGNCCNQRSKKQFGGRITAMALLLVVAYGSLD